MAVLTLAPSTDITITARPFHVDTDFERVRGFLAETYALYGRQFNWGLERWETNRFAGHVFEEVAGERQWERDTRLWETLDGRLVGVVNPEGAGEFYIQIHPDYRHIEDQMMAWAEAHHQAACPLDATTWPLCAYADERDDLRQDLLARRGYTYLGVAEAFRTYWLDEPRPDIPLPPGYLFRNLRLDDPDDLARLTATNNVTFGCIRWTAQTIRVLARARTYRPDLDFVVEAPDGTVAAFCTVWYDPRNRVATFEPVGTHPDHRRRGLASAMMLLAMERLAALGAVKAHVNTGAAYYANRVYEAIGFTHADRNTGWQKELAW